MLATRQPWPQPQPLQELNAAKSGINIALLTSALDDAREERDRLAENENVMQNKVKLDVFLLHASDSLSVFLCSLDSCKRNWPTLCSTVIDSRRSWLGIFARNKFVLSFAAERKLTTIMNRLNLTNPSRNVIIFEPKIRR